MRAVSFFCVIFAAFFLTASSVNAADGSTIQKGKKVKFDYTLKVGGETLESSVGKQPLEYTHGAGNIIPGLESQLEGMHVGEEKKVVVAPKDGYGEIDSKAFQEIPKGSFPKDKELKQGMVIEMQSPEGAVVPGMISEIKDQTVVVDFNHPLAGKTLEFDVKIVEIN